MTKVIRLTCVAVLFAPIYCHAQTYHIEGTILDAFTREKLDSVHITLMSPDSIVQEEFDARPLGSVWQSYQDIQRPGHYIMRFSRHGYEDTFKNVYFKYQKYRRTSGTFGEVLMRKLPRRNSIDLPEVTVTATKIKMVMKGDTVVYNADAFQLSEGSMLDELLKRLPGMRLEGNGEIFMNGEKVQSLLVNGEEFFHGDPKVALDNLPAYMVDKVKVYGRLNDKLVALGIDPRTHGQKLPLVVDVGLKREYCVGLIANATAGYGTSNHYEGRLFALRFTDRSRFTIIANSNDIRCDSYYDQNGNWQSPGADTDDITTHETRIDWLYTDKKKRWKFNDYASWKWKHRRSEEKESSVTFADSEASVFGRRGTSSQERTWTLGLKGTNSFTPRRGSFFELKPNLNYTNAHNLRHELSADYTQQLTESYMGEALDSLFLPNSEGRWRQNLLSSLRYDSRSQWHQWHLGGDATSAVKYMAEDRLDIGLGGFYEHERSWSRYTSADAYNLNRQSRYSEHPTSSYRYYAQTAYTYALDMPTTDLYLRPHYRYTQAYRSDHRPYYRLEGTDMEAWTLDRLSSSKDTIAQMADYSNTYYSQQWNRTHDLGLGVTIRFKGPWTEHGDMTLDLDLPIQGNHDRLDYLRATTDTIINRDKWFFNPEATFAYDHNNGRVERHFRLGYDLNSASPQMTWLVNYRDDATPLVVRYGNGNLADRHRHHAYVSYRRFAHQSPSRMMWNARIDWRLWQNMLCQGMTYDTHTGVRSYRPATIDGNWELAAQLDFYTQLMADNRLSLDGRTTVSYRNSDDLVSFSESVSSVRNGVRRTLTTQNLRLRLEWKPLSLNLSGALTWNHAESDRYDTMNAFDIRYGGEADIRFPKDFRLSTSLRMYSRHGYADNRFCANQLIWNASLRKNLIGSKLQLTIEGFDLLNRMAAYSYTVDAQMQREVWRNVLHRYLLATLTWRLNAH